MGICGTALSVLALAHSGAGLETYLNSAGVHARNRLLENISRSDTKPGHVVAATSKNNPAYYYHWVRDAALVFVPVLNLYKAETNPALKRVYRQRIEEFRAASREHQLTDNPSGTITSGGLGEPKFNVDGSAYWDSWGRPQNDGPALRAITLIDFAESLLDSGEEETVRQTLYDAKAPTNTVIKSDLEYVSHEWDRPCIDLWEEAWGDHFYTRLVQRRALLRGASLARRLGDKGAADWYESQARAIEKKMDAHWDASAGYLRATLNPSNPHFKSSELDVAIVLASMHASGSDNYYGVTDDRVQATLGKLVQRFFTLYPINQTKKTDANGNPLGIAIGRYAEDTYDGYGRSEGHPWALATLAVAEFLFRASNAWQKEGFISLTPRTRGFLNDLGVNPGPADKYQTHQAEFTTLIQEVHRVADTYLARVRFHSHANGDMNEQIDRHWGHMRGAENLTWSYASLITALEAKQLAGAFAP